MTDTERIAHPSEVESLIQAALTIAVSEWDPDAPLPRGQMVRLGTHHVLMTLRLYGYLPDEETR